jgi:hypothetical protein
VSQVATVDSKQDFLTADVKVYQTTITINAVTKKDPRNKGKLKGLKPGMSAEVTILLDRVEHPVLTVPLQAVLDPEDTDKPYTVYVKTPDGVERRPVVLGLNNDKVVEVKDGLEEGDEVVMNPSKLLKGKDSGKEGPSKNKKKKKAEFGPGKSPPKPKGPRVKPGAPAGQARGGPQAGFDPKKWIETMKKASPAERKAMFDKIPKDRQPGARAWLKSQGIEIPN